MKDHHDTKPTYKGFNCTIRAFKNRVMTAEQRRAMFAKMSSGGGAGSGPTNPPDSSPAPDAPAQPEGPGRHVLPIAAGKEAGPGNKPSTYDAETRKAAKQKEIDLIIEAQPAKPAATSIGKVQDLAKFEAALKEEGMTPTQRSREIEKVKAENQKIIHSQREMYRKALKATEGDRVKAEVMVQKEMKAQETADAKALERWQRDIAKDMEKITGLWADMDEIDATANERAAKDEVSADTAAEKAKTDRYKADMKAQIAKDQEAARARLAEAKAQAAADKEAAKGEKPADPVKAYKAEQERRKQFWQAVKREDYDAARGIYPTVKREDYEAAMKNIPKDKKAAADYFRALSLTDPAFSEAQREPVMKNLLGY